MNAIIFMFFMTSCSFGQNQIQENNRLAKVIKAANSGIRDTTARALHNKGMQAIRENNILLAKDYLIKADKLEPKNVLINL